VDHDADAVEAAQANLTRNGVRDAVAARVADLGAADFPAGELAADVVTANLTVHLLRRFARAITSCVRPGGVLVTSGFTLDQVPLVLEAFAGFTLQARDEEDDWASLTLRR
jgi:ribosomal protein L11 methyltransferase